MEKEESPTDATVELDGDDMEGSGEEGDLEGRVISEAAQWADQEQWFGMQWPSALAERLLSFSTSEKHPRSLVCVCVCALRRDAVMLTAAFCWWVIDTDVNRICGWHLDLLAFWCVWSLVLSFQFCHIRDYLSHYENTALHWFDLSSDMNSLTPAWPQDQIHKWFTLNGFSNIS